MSLNVDNCPICGKIYVKNFRGLCTACIKEIEEQYNACANYLRKNRGATIYELSEETGVSVKQITKFIREGRISLMDAPNMSYPCESCGLLIREHTLCPACRSRFTRSFNQLNSETERRKRDGKSSGTTYQTKDWDR